jgi:hypothetical protein
VSLAHLKTAGIIYQIKKRENEKYIPQMGNDFLVGSGMIGMVK